MEKDSEQNFVFGSDDTDVFHESNQNQRIDKLNQKITILAFLTLAIIGAIGAFFYMDVKNKVVQVHNSGTSEVQKTAQEFHRELSEFQLIQSELAKQLSDKISNLEKKLGSAPDAIKKNENDIKYLGSVIVSQKIFKSEIQPVKDSIDALKKDLEALNGQNAKLVAIAQELQKRINEITQVKEAQMVQKNSLEQLQAAFDVMKTDMERLKNTAADKQELDTALKKQNAIYRLQIEDLGSKISSLEKTVNALKNSTATPSPAPAGAQ